uniref:D-isomer specific 2-hydroxyacid dehydrogenase NAD-binding domain-containing protein n=1 Tax=Araucaria cunninghamii TaxID=56994 RepID=A0A0D6QWQ4_ARACU
MTKIETSATRAGNGRRGGLGEEEALPLVVALNCLEECKLEEEMLQGIAMVQHIELSRIAEGRIESAMAVLVHSLAYLPRAAQRRLQPWQLILCLGSSDKAVDSALATDLGLQLLHVDSSRAEEVADSVMALLLGLIRHTHMLTKQGFSTSGFLGALQPLCRGMRRCRGLVLGIIGRSASACALASRSLAFKMRVLYYDYEQVKGRALKGRRSFPPAAKQMDTLNDLLSASDLVSLHCAATNETLQILNAETLQHIKPGAFIVNSSSCHLLDDCALKQLLIDGTVAGCALDGAEGPQWMEAWVREMPNVLILPRSADYSEEVWMTIREKAVSILHSFFLDGVVPSNAVSDEDDDLKEVTSQEERSEKQDKERRTWVREGEHLDDESQASPEFRQKQTYYQSQEPRLHSQDSGISQNSGGQREGRHARSGKKGKKRPGRRKSRQNSESAFVAEQENNCVALQRDDRGASISGRDQVLSSSSRFASPEDTRHRRSGDIGSAVDTASEKQTVISKVSYCQPGDLLKDGLVISLRSKGRPGYHVSRQRGPGGGWFLDTMSNVTKRDPAAQFLVVFQSKDRIGLRSLAAGGKLLQVNRKMDLAFASHNFDAWESWILEGTTLEDCRLTNSRVPLAVLDVSIEILAAISEEDGIARWLS